MRILSNEEAYKTRNAAAKAQAKAEAKKAWAIKHPSAKALNNAIAAQWAAEQSAADAADCCTLGELGLAIGIGAIVGIGNMIIDHLNNR